MNALISTTEAESLIQGALPSLSSERVPLALSIGRTLAVAMRADRDLPPYARAMMDGIAIRSSETPPFKIQGLHAAGDRPAAALLPGHAWEIMTGACLPDDCDTVVPYEHLSGDRCSILEDWKPGQFVHQPGSDARAGDVLVTANRPMGAAEVAIAASVGLTQLEVTRRPRVALVSSGNEAVEVGARPEAWQIRRSNGPMLDAVLTHACMPPVVHHHVADEPDETQRALDDALGQADVVILCGGISKGKMDLMRPLLEQRLGAPLFHGVRQKPGKPLACWAGPPFVFALPGNPVSVLATFSRYVLPALHGMSGQRHEPQMRACPEGIESLPEMAWLLALGAGGDIRLVSNSGDFAALAGAVGFLELPPGAQTEGHPMFPFYPSHPVII